jgi:hypothetical protein
LIALVGAYRLGEARRGDYAYSVRPRWDLSSLGAPASAIGAPLR